MTHAPATQNNDSGPGVLGWVSLAVFAGLALLAIGILASGGCEHHHYHYPPSPPPTVVVAPAPTAPSFTLFGGKTEVTVKAAEPPVVYKNGYSVSGQCWSDTSGFEISAPGDSRNAANAASAKDNWEEKLRTAHAASATQARNAAPCYPPIVPIVVAPPPPPPVIVVPQRTIIVRSWWDPF